MTDRNARPEGEGAMEQLGRSMGEAAGRLAGQAADMAAEVATPLIRSAAEVLGGWWSGESAREAASSWTDRDERRWREHHRTEAGGSSYDDVRPYYQLGHTAARNPDYSARGFEDVEPDLERVWAEGEAGSEEWPKARGYVQFGYAEGGDRGTSGADSDANTGAGDGSPGL